MCRLIFAILALFWLCSGINADASISAANGNTVSIWCKSPDKTSVFWQYQREITDRDKFLSTGTSIAEPYRSRMGLDTLSGGQVILTIHNITTHDSGIYVCSEEAGFGAKHYTRLLVKEPHTHSSELATVGDTVQLQCRTTVQIRVIWTRRRLDRSTEETLTTETHVLPQHTSKFALASVSHGDYALTIRNVLLEDSGFYSCVEAGRSQHTVNFTVADRNECLSNPCANGGSCVDDVNKYTCVCPEGFTGANCDKDIDECSSNPCMNDGLCVDLIRKYVCACLPGFSGKRCENNIVRIETPTKKMDHIGLSGSAVGLIVSLVFIFVVVVIFFVLLTVWYRNKQQRRQRDLEKSQEMKPLQPKYKVKEDNNNKHDTALTEQLNFVNGITLVNNKLFVLRWRDLSVYGTSIEPHQLVRQLQLPELSPHTRNDMTSCSERQSLYISDYNNACILKLELHENGEIVEVEEDDESSVTKKRTKVTRWSVNGHGKPSGVSVTNHNRLLVSCLEGRVLVQLTTEGELCTKRQPSFVGISIESHLYDPMQAIEVNNKFVVCHAGDGIWLLDEEGTIKKSLNNAGLEDKPTYAQLAWPCNLAIANNGLIYVADHYNDRVVELSPELEYIRELVPPSQKMLRPRRLFFDKKNDKLYIGLFNGEVRCVSVNNEH